MDATGTRSNAVWLMAAGAVAFAAASLVHFGATAALGPLSIDDRFPGAAVPEAVIAVVLALGAASLVGRWRGGRRLALAAGVFSLLLTLLGLTITARTARTGDVVYHVAVLALLAVIVGALFRRAP